ncbi:ABC transporter substrate-binding protein [Methylobacter tundripaludum]|uniref:ABC-type transporter, periplasmic subunit n=1 Tax=Methylobacter tundripaludum (strain ATCC BAA-1195 / DSM 17260 / SV96) TaxID=697282 RepID=G3J0J8_METTV|nr:ABC transporter substrate-binding protein [Methylobacter tundripaludum]EGW20720.1 ABC-type transporter, periplasmic subunit [Methylobacter tundripaludum SV96]
MTLLLMSSLLSMKMQTCKARVLVLMLSVIFWAASYSCAAWASAQPNNPYPEDEDKQVILYESFSERPKHMDPAVAYSSNEYAFIAQIYEPPFQYHYLKRPYQVVPLTATRMPEVIYLNQKGDKLEQGANDNDIAFTDYMIEIQHGIRYQPHPALATNTQGDYEYHQLSTAQIKAATSLNDFNITGSRELTAEDYVYQIKRLAHPKIQSPIAEIMKNYIVGFDNFSRQVKDKPKTAIRNLPIAGVTALSRYQYRIRIKGKYPQFIYWLAMPFFSPMPWEADVFYDQAGLADKNITLDWFPIGTGPYLMAENNPNRRMILLKNPLFHLETYPTEGEPEDKQKGLLTDAGKQLPFIDKVVFMLEKETIPYWTKFLQGYYDASGIASDSFDQAIQFTGSGGVALTPTLLEKGIQLQTSVTTSSFYMGFNMLDATVGGATEQARKLRQAIAIAVDYEEFISIFMNGRGVAAQGVLPPGIYGFAESKEGINPYIYDWLDGKAQRKKIDAARQLMAEAGYAGGIDPKTKEALILYFDTTATSVDDRPRMNWYRKQFEKLGIKLVIRATDYNRFQEKMRTGNAQLFVWGWNADYPDPENFFFLLYGANSKVQYGGENAANYHNPEFDRLFEQMRNMDNSEQRYRIIQQLQEIARHDAPWIFGFHPKNFALFHSWYKNLKPNLMANNQLKYTRIDTAARAEKRQQWNEPVFWPLVLGGVVFVLMLIPAVNAYRRRVKETKR